jgi:hypothetical protein
LGIFNGLGGNSFCLGLRCCISLCLGLRCCISLCLGLRRCISLCLGLRRCISLRLGLRRCVFNGLGSFIFCVLYPSSIYLGVFLGNPICFGLYPNGLSSSSGICGCSIRCESG